MHSFKEIVARLVIVANVLIIVETRARYIYQPGPFFECQIMEIECGGHSKETCNEYCEANGFSQGSCNGHCCLCDARTNGMLPLELLLQRQHSVVNRPSTPAKHLDDKSKIIPSAAAPQISSNVKLDETIESKPKRSAFITSNEFFGKKISTNNNFGIEHSSKSINNVVPQQHKHNSQSTDIGNICLTQECVKTASSILENLDENVSPCDDFYQFACGNFQKEQRIPDDKGGMTLMGTITDKLTEQLREILETDITHDSEHHSSLLAKTVYDSCMNSGRMEQLGISPLKKVVDNLGGWPVLEENWNSNSWSWEKTIGDFRRTGLATDYLIKVSVVNDLKNPDLRTLHIGEPLLSFSREQLHNPHFNQAYQKFQVNVAKLLGADSAKAGLEMAKVFEFERTLANISLPRELSRGHPLNFYHPMTIGELNNKFPSVNWLSYMTALLPENVEVDETQVVNVHVPDQLKVLLDAISKTDKRVLANYLFWRASSSVLQYLDENAMRVQQDFMGSLSGRKQRKPRWRECIDVTSKTLGQAMGAMYVRKHFDEASKEIAIEMVNDIRKAFVGILATMEWMDEETKKRAFEKAAKMTSNIGYPKELLDEEKLKKLYNGLELSSDNFFGNILNLTKGATDFGMGKLKQRVDKNDWIQFGKPAMVNAFYQPFTNSIQFPAGILQGRFFDKNRPNFMNYGAIGWVIGHEIAHGFDDQGSRFDQNGEIKDWWNPVTKHHFHEKAKCLVEQYGSFTYKDVLRNVTFPLNGVVSVGENIADNGGIKQAYSGYQAWVQRNGEEKKLPGLKYTPDQLFWISAANNWCSKIRPQQMVEAIQMGVHSPGEYRVRGTFANMEQFSKDFSCPIGSPMNPANKCSVW